MNIELTTDNLRKSCRICLNLGELDIWGNVFVIDDVKDDLNDESQNVTPIELFKIYDNFEKSLLSFKEDLSLLCYSCLDELTNCYIFYKKAVVTNQKLERLYEEAKKFEAEQQTEEEKEDLVDDESEKETEPDVETQSNITIEEFDDQIYYLEEEEPFIDVRPSQTNENIETDSSYDKLAEDEIFDTTSIIEEVNTSIEETKVDSLIEDCEESKQYLTKRSSGIRLPHEDGSFVVTQFFASTAHIVVDSKDTMSSIQEDDDGGGYRESPFTTPDLSTVDYAAVEMKRSDFHEIVEEDELCLQANTKTEPSEILDTLSIYGKQEQQGTSNKVYICKYCPQAFAAPHYLIAHVRKSHVCKYCTQAFTKSMDLFVHIRQAHHQHKCAICHKELSSHSNLRGHIKRVHGIRLPTQTTLLDYRPPDSNAADIGEPLRDSLDETDMNF